MLMRYNIITLYFMAMYTLPKNSNILLKILLYFWRFICALGLGSLAILCLTDVALKEDYNFVDVSANILNAGIFTGALIRILYYYAYDYKVEKIVVGMNQIFRYKSSTGLQEKDTENSLRFVKIFIGFWTTIVFFTGEFTALLPLAFLHKIGRTIAIPAWYPYDWHQTNYYILTIFTQALTQAFMGFAYGNPDMFYVCCLHQTATQFKLLAWEFKNILYTALLKCDVDPESVVAFSKTFNNDFVNEKQDYFQVGFKEMSVVKDYQNVMDVLSSRRYQEVLEKCFEESIERHQLLLSFCELIDDFFSPILLPCIGFGLFYIIFISFTLIITTNSSAFMGLVEYLVTAVFQVFLVCIFGAFLTNEADQVSDALYASPWYLCNNKFLTTFKIVHYRACKPIVIKAGNYFSVGTDLFISICKTSASYFAVLRQVTELQEE